MDNHHITIDLMDYIDFFIEYLNSHIYIKASTISKDYVSQKLEITHYNRQYHQIQRSLQHKLKRIIFKAKESGIIEPYTSSNYKVKGKNCKLTEFSEVLKNRPATKRKPILEIQLRY